MLTVVAGYPQANLGTIGSDTGDVVARLGQRGLVSVERHDGDRRRRLVALTPVALDLLRELMLPAERVHRELCAPLSDDEGRRLTNNG